MKKDLFLKRLYSAALAALFIYSIVKKWQNMLGGRGLDTGIIISGIGLIAAGYYFFHPEKFMWKVVSDARRMRNIVLLTFVSGFLCLFYLYFGVTAGWPEDWNIICILTGLLALGGYLMLTFENKKKE